MRKLARQRNGAVIVVLLLSVLLALAGCRHLGEPTDPEVLRHQHWWNFYRRGVARSIAGRWAEAAADFETALGMRPGAALTNARESWRAKTYGLHFLDDYFPHRELGICQFYLGRLEKAERELGESLRQEPSSRARDYLNQVHRAQLEQSGVPVPRQDVALEVGVRPVRGPAGDLEVGGDGVMYTRCEEVIVRGTARSRYRVATLTVSGEPLLIELATEALDFSHRVLLHPGANEVLVRVADLAGNQGRWQRTVVLDLTAPTISLRRRAAADNGGMEVAVEDDHGLASVSVNGRRVPMPTSGGGRRCRVTVPSGSASRISVRAVDRAGNESGIEQDLSDFEGAMGPVDGRYADRRLAAVGVLIAAAPAADTMGPRLQIRNMTADGCRVTTSFCVMDVEAFDSGGIQAVIFVLGDQREEVRPSGTAPLRYRFTQLLNLKPGSNRITVTVRDAAGNETAETVTVERLESCFWREDLRMAAQIIPPDPGDVALPTRVELHPRLLDELLANRRLNIVERDPAVLERLLLEQQISASRLGDVVAAVRSGRLKPADWLVTSQLTRWGGRDDWQIFVRVIDVETSEHVLTTDMHFSGFDDDHVRLRLHGLVRKFEQMLPRISGPVQDVRGGRAMVPLGSRDGVVRHMRFLFLPGREAEPEFADPLMLGEAWVQGKVVRVEDSRCQVELSPRKGSQVVGANDLAVLR